MESQRQKKISLIIQKEIASLINEDLRRGGVKNLIISVTKTKISPDLSLCKIYLSVFPSSNSSRVLEQIQGNASKIKHDLSGKLKKAIRKIPDLVFYIDDSLDYIDSVEDSIKNPKNPIKQ